MLDSYKHKGLRKRLVEEIRSKGIVNEHVLMAINKVPRHLFIDSGFVSFAYKDQAFPIGAGQTISQPYTVAFQTSLMDVKPGDKVLEIGTGSGYQTAILIEMGALVFSIERKKELFIKAGKILDKMGYKARLFYGDGYEGKPGYGPFDKILITAGAPVVPYELKKQLCIGGLMIVPLGGRDYQIMTRIIKISENKYRSEEHGSFVFVPFVKGIS